MKLEVHTGASGGALVRWLVLPALAVLATGCAYHAPGIGGVAGVSPSPDQPWQAPAGTAAAPAAMTKETKIPPELAAAGKSWTLADIVDLALRNSTDTRIAWQQARSAAAAYGSRRGDYLPDVSVNVTGTRQQGAASGGRTAFQQKSASAGADLTWLLFNFGGRRASVEEARQALVAADWTHNAAIQSVILDVEQAYFNYVATRSLREAEDASVQDARANLAAAEARHTAGVATIADVLRARTALSQARLVLETLDGAIQTTRGVLATAMGLPANTGFDVEVPTLDVPADTVMKSVDASLADAAARRPDLFAARAEAERARAHVRKVQADGWPSIQLGGNAARNSYFDPDHMANTYSGTLSVRFPLFTGFSHGYDVAQARADAEAAGARLESAEQRVVLQVWTSYYDLRTAGQRVRTSDDLLKSAVESHEVAAGQYKAGVGSILDLLSAQSALESARAQQVQARAEWYLAVAQLAHATGTLQKEGPQ